MMTADRWLVPDNDYGWGVINVWAAINYDKFTTGVSGEIFIPDEFSVTKAFPNPFNPKVNFYVNIGKPGQISLSIYNLLGQPVDEVFEGEMSPGVHAFSWTPNHHPSGIYFIYLEHGAGSSVEKITYLK